MMEGSREDAVAESRTPKAYWMLMLGGWMFAGYVGGGPLWANLIAIGFLGGAYATVRAIEGE